MSDPYLLRKSEESDLAFIYSTWTKSYRYNSIIGKSCISDIFFKEYKSVIDFILSKSDTKLLILCIAENNEVIIGYIVYQCNILHYIYVKEAFRHLGLGTLMSKITEFKWYTHLTFHINPIIHKYPNMVYNPFLLFNRGVIHGT